LEDHVRARDLVIELLYAFLLCEVLISRRKSEQERTENQILERLERQREQFEQELRGTSAFSPRPTQPSEEPLETSKDQNIPTARSTKRRVADANMMGKPKRQKKHPINIPQNSAEPSSVPADTQESRAEVTKANEVNLPQNPAELPATVLNDTQADTTKEFGIDEVVEGEGNHDKLSSTDKDEAEKDDLEELFCETVS
jgi:hypothetical protein